MNLGNFRVGLDGLSQSFAVENLTAGDWAESLGIAASATGNFAANNTLGGALIAGGAKMADAASVAVSNGVAGANAGLSAVCCVRLFGVAAPAPHRLILSQRDSRLATLVADRIR